MMKVLMMLLVSLAAAMAIPTDYKKPQYKEVEYNEAAPPPPPKEPDYQPEAVKPEEPVDKTVYPYTVTKGFPYDYRGFPYINNEYMNGYPAPRQGYYAPMLPYYGYPAGAPVYHAPGYHAPGYQAPGYQAPGYQAPIYQAPAYKAPAPQPQQHASMKYHGQFAKGCVGDGIYYKDNESFVLCSNNNAYIQRCAPGTQNAGVGHFTYGNKYSSNDLCGVNLVDTGYGPSNVAY